MYDLKGWGGYPLSEYFVGFDLNLPPVLPGEFQSRFPNWNTTVFFTFQPLAYYFMSWIFSQLVKRSSWQFFSTTIDIAWKRRDNGSGFLNSAYDALKRRVICNCAWHLSQSGLINAPRTWHVLKTKRRVTKTLRLTRINYKSSSPQFVIRKPERDNKIKTPCRTI